MRSQGLNTLVVEETGDDQAAHSTTQEGHCCDTSPAHQALEEIIEGLRVEGVMPSRQVDKALETIGSLTTGDCVAVIQKFRASKPTESHAAVISQYEARSSGVRYTKPLPEHRL
ncbi:MAG TPA: hypothetical protein VJB82_00245 [Candidatus Peribacterales bacterium]|nr:hypothetical protein [Candidatus Peribacterales bacterium]